MKSLKTEKQKIEKEIYDMRYKVNKYLDDLQEKLIKDLQILSHSENEKILALIQKLKERETELLQYKETFNQIKNMQVNYIFFWL